MMWTRRQRDEDEDEQQDVWDVFPEHLQRGWTKVKHDNSVHIPSLLVDLRST